MAPNLQGLNIIHSPPPAADAQDLIGQPYPDLAVQLDLWSNLTFDSDEGPIAVKNDDDSPPQKSVDDEEDIHSSHFGTPEAAILDGHVNVVTGTNLGTNHQHTSQSLDFSSILAAIGIDPFSPPQHNAALAPSIAQLLALQGSNLAHPGTTPVVLPVHQQHHQPRATERQALADDLQPPAKKARNRRSSDSMTPSVEGTSMPEQTAVLAAEDKRRRNTAASARFRLKKKEREAALEGKAKELEVRVGELERECEALRRENGWLKGLVIGVTGAVQAPAVVGATPGKRSRDEAGVSQHPLRSPRLAPKDTDAGITRPYLSRLTQDVGDDSVSDKKPVNDRQERIVIVHKVSPKDSLPGVSLRYGIPLAELRRTNQLWPSDPIHLRDVLYIPVDKATRTRSSLDDEQSTSRPDIPPSATIQRVPSSQLSFFPPSRSGHRRRRRRSLTDSQMPRSQPATLSRNHTRSHSHHSARLSSLLTALPTPASTRNSIVPRLSFDSITSSFDDRSRSQSDNEENHELEVVTSRLSLDGYPTEAKMPRNDVYDSRPSSNIPRHMPYHRTLPLSPPSSYISPSPSLSVIRTVQMEPSPIMQIPKKMNSTLIHDHLLKEGKQDSLFSRSKAYASAHDLTDTDAMNKRLLR